MTVEDTVNSKAGRQPFSHIITTFVVDIEILGSRIDDTVVIMREVKCQIALELLTATAQGEVVLLHHLLFIHSISKFLRKVILLQMLYLLF